VKEAINFADFLTGEMVFCHKNETANCEKKTIHLLNPSIEILT
jgi:hypothetical protein